MASSSDFTDAGMFSGQKLPEKTMFTQTCSLLREYLKEKNGSFGELSLGMSLGGLDVNAAPTSNFFPAVEKSTGVPAWDMAAATTHRNVKPMNLFHQQSGFGAPVLTDDLPKMAADHCVNKPAITEPEKAQMTIFYNGQVLVFNDFPANKAKEVMRLASMGSSKNPSNFPTTPVRKPNDSASSNVAPNMGISICQDRIQNCPQPIHLPIARKASLARFLEKRKDRINARAPYDMSGAFAASSKPTESKSWLALAAQSSNAV